jgi:hypothetical protein
LLDRKKTNGTNTEVDIYIYYGVVICFVCFVCFVCLYIVYIDIVCSVLYRLLPFYTSVCTDSFFLFLFYYHFIFVFVIFRYILFSLSLFLLSSFNVSFSPILCTINNIVGFLLIKYDYRLYSTKKPLLKRFSSALPSCIVLILFLLLW